jgi:hypothetical protein
METRRIASEPLPRDHVGLSVTENERIVKLLAVTVMLSEGDGCTLDHETRIESPLR